MRNHPHQQEFNIREDVNLRFTMNSPMPLDSTMDKWVYPMWKILTFLHGV